MRSSKTFFLFMALTTAVSMAAMAAHIDFNDPRRALGREDDVRVDAELGQDALSPNSPISVTCQIQNLSRSTIAIADKVSDVSFDRDSQMVTVSIGAEIPPRTMPHLTMIEPGAKHVFTAGGLLHVAVPSGAAPGFPVPRLVQVKVTVLKNLTPFAGRRNRRPPSSSRTTCSTSGWTTARPSFSTRCRCTGTRATGVRERRGERAVGLNLRHCTRIGVGVS